MKKLNFLLIVILMSTMAFSQDYFSFPDSNAIWNEYSIHVEYPTSVSSKTRYGIIGDTTINDKDKITIRPKKEEKSKIEKIINVLKEKKDEI